MYVGKPPTRHVVVGLPTCVVGGKPTQHVVVGLPPTQHVVVGLPTCVVGGKPTTTCCCWYILQPTPPTPTHQGIS